MADADLDDFFAKKDRKKAKGKKFTTTEEIAKKLEETGKKIEKPKPKEKPANPEGGDENQQVEVGYLVPCTFFWNVPNYFFLFYTSNYSFHTVLSRSPEIYLPTGLFVHVKSMPLPCLHACKRHSDLLPLPRLPR